MPDVFTKAKRSDVMSRIRGRGNRGTELALAKLLRAARITGWRRHAALLGRPDFMFRKQRVVIFVDGCFWHGCLKHSNMPTNNREFWLKKLTGNKGRDRLVTRALRQSGWRVLRIWEHELRKPGRVLSRLHATLALQETATKFSQPPASGAFTPRQPEIRPFRSPRNRSL